MLHKESRLQSFTVKSISAIFQSSIVWSAVIGFAFLKEKLHWLDLVSIPFTLSGIILIAKRRFQPYDLLSSLFFHSTSLSDTQRHPAT